MVRLVAIVLIGVTFALANPSAAQQSNETKYEPDAIVLKLAQVCVSDARKGPKIVRDLMLTPSQSAARQAAVKASEGKSHVEDTGEGIRAVCAGQLAQRLYSRFVELGLNKLTYIDLDAGQPGCYCDKDAQGQAFCFFEVSTMAAKDFGCGRPPSR